MTIELLLSMSAFALASSISPGPVNIMALRFGTQHGVRSSFAFVSGATIGFTLLLLGIGSVLHRLLQEWPQLGHMLQWGGVAFLVYMGYQLARDDGRLDTRGSADRPSLSLGALMQWLNPKAWLASVAGIGAYANKGDFASIWLFALIYFLICYASIASWAYAGTVLRQLLKNPRQMQIFNRGMAALLLTSAAYLVCS